MEFKFLKIKVSPHNNSLYKFQHGNDKEKELLLWKDRAHTYFDLLWNLRGYCSRQEAYDYLAKFLECSACNSHISNASVTRCKKVIKWSIKILNEGRKIDKKFKNIHWDEIKMPEYLVV